MTTLRERLKAACDDGPMSGERCTCLERFEAVRIALNMATKLVLDNASKQVLRDMLTSLQEGGK